jgi:outer membrane receptor protein involved in Fe transport
MFLRLLRTICLTTTTFLLLIPVSTTVFGEGSNQGRVIEEIIVTAERREAAVNDTPIAITAFTSELIEDFGIRNQEDLQAMVPAAVIEPYDMAIRGVGRNFRNLGGDPGIATYQNGVYSEDFGIASTEGGLFDIDRIEFLRGPQGTLYGRNAIGGAVNFHNKLPTDEFYAEFRGLVGSYDLQEIYGVVSGPLIEDKLSARFVGMNRERDGYYDDLSGNTDPGDFGDENYALSFRWTPKSNMTFNIRGNERSYHRLMGGADAAGILNLTENGGEARDNTTYAFGYRAVDPAIPCPDMFTRTPQVPTPGITPNGGAQGVGCMITGQETFNFTNPLDGSAVSAQRVTPGVDSAAIGTTNSPNLAYQTDLSKQRMLGIGDLDGDDLKTDTNGNQDEFFDHQAMYLNFTWDVSDEFSVKYIFGYTDYFYDRTSDVDLTSNDILDDTFYVSQDSIYESHELQFFWDPNEKLTITAGMFDYSSRIRQRGDFYDSTCGDLSCRYAQDDPSGALAIFPKMDLFTAHEAHNQFLVDGTLPEAIPGVPATTYCIPGGGVGFDQFCFGNWLGDTGDSVPHGPNTIGTNLEYQTKTQRDSQAVYLQGTYQISEQFALTLGLRWAEDELEGYEDLFYYAEDTIIPLGFGAGGTGCVDANCSSDLAGLNMAFGFLGADGTILDPKRLFVAGLPASQSLHRGLSRKDDDITWRVNLDYAPNNDTLLYASATKGLRSAGFNLVFFSAISDFDPEELISYEVGYKGTLRDGSMQVNLAAYFYDYENVHTLVQGPSATGGYSTNIFPVPTAEMVGIDAEVTWLATNRLTIGLHGSYTDAEYTSDAIVINPNDPNNPESLFSPFDNQINLKGNRMLRVPEYKAGGWAMYRLPLSARGSIDFTMNYSYIDRVYFSTFEDKNHSAEPYDRLDFRVAWRASDSLTVSLFVNNVMDEVGLRQVDHYGSTEDAGWRQRGTASDPRLYGLEVRYKMGAF